MRLTIALVAAGAAALAGCNAEVSEETPERPHLAYALSYESGETPALLVDVSFTGDSDGVTWLGLPTAWGGVETPWDGLTDFTAVSDLTEIRTTESPSVLAVHHVPGAEVHVQYRIPDPWGRAPEPGDGNPYRPIVTDDYIQLIGWTTWAVPQWDEWPGENPEVAFDLDWSGLPADWAIADNFGTGRNMRTAISPLNRLQGGILVAGDFRLLDRPTGNSQLNIAIRGDWPFEDDLFADQLQAIVEALRVFWREEGSEPYLVTLIPIHRPEGYENALSWGGTGLVDSFGLFATTNTSLENFENLAAHEFQHRWTPSEIGEMADPEEGTYWFSEGFTDYYATLLSLRGGMIDLQGFADQTNAALRAYYRSPVREAPVADVIEGFWLDRDLQRLPYLRGRFLAARWNAEYMQISNGQLGLDVILFDLLEAGRAARDAGAPRQITSEEIFMAAANRFLSNAPRDYYAYIVNGGMVPIEQGMFGPCFDVRETEFDIFDMGFDMQGTQAEGAYVGVREGGPAWNAGLRDGMTFGGWSINNFGDPDTTALLYAIADDERVEFAYQPRSGEVEIIPQLFLPDDLSDEARDECLAWWGAN